MAVTTVQKDLEEILARLAAVRLTVRSPRLSVPSSPRHIRSEAKTRNGRCSAHRS